MLDIKDIQVIIEGDFEDARAKAIESFTNKGFAGMEFGIDASTDRIKAYNRELAKQTGLAVALTSNVEQALRNVADSFGDKVQEPRLVVVSKEVAMRLREEGIKADLMVEDAMPRIGQDFINELNSLAPVGTGGYSTYRKGKGERKRASRQQRQQWRK